MQRKTFAAALLAASAVAATAAAQPWRDREPTWHTGTPVNVFADPSDFVVELDQPGRCGSKYFHIKRSSQNFDEMVAVALTAFSAGKRLTFVVPSRVSFGVDNRFRDAFCTEYTGAGSGDRNVVSHGFASR